MFRSLFLSYSYVLPLFDTLSFSTFKKTLHTNAMATQEKQTHLLLLKRRDK
jgi:hypothetical protein